MFVTTDHSTLTTVIPKLELNIPNFKLLQENVLEYKDKAIQEILSIDMFDDSKEDCEKLGEIIDHRRQNGLDELRANIA